jgi:hypothetical protein
MYKQYIVIEEYIPLTFGVKAKGSLKNYSKYTPPYLLA